MNDLPEVRMRCDHCEKEFLGPPLQLFDEWIFRVEETAKFCSVACAEAEVEESMVISQ